MTAFDGDAPYQPVTPSAGDEPWGPDKMVVGHEGRGSEHLCHPRGRAKNGRDTTGPRRSNSHGRLLASALVGRKFFITQTSSVLAPTV